MKNALASMLLFSLLLVILCCNKGSFAPTNNGNNNNNNGNNNNGDTTSLVTKIGTPIGSPVTKTIDASGGSITSPDGVLKLTIPPGALSVATNISIQPVTNEVPVGLYNAYSLTPNGQQFQKPVTLEFHYSDQDMDTVDPEGLAVAYQDGDQTWEAFTDVAVDTVNKTVSVQSPHFTIFTLLPDIDRKSVV